MNKIKYKIFELDNGKLSSGENSMSPPDYLSSNFDSPDDTVKAVKEKSSNLVILPVIVWEN